MKRLLLATIPWMALAGIAHGQVRSADVLYTFRDTIPLRASRVGDECFVAIDLLQQLGWSMTTHGMDVEIMAEGKKLYVMTRSVEGRPAVPLRKLIQQLGGDSTWQPQTDTLVISSPLTTLSARDGRIHFTSPLEVQPNIVYMASPDRAVVDIRGARLSTKSKWDAKEDVQMVQYRPNVVRMTVPLSSAIQAPGIFTPTQKFDYTLKYVVAPTAQVVTPPPHVDGGSMPIRGNGSTTPKPPDKSTSPATAPGKETDPASIPGIPPSQVPTGLEIPVLPRLEREDASFTRLVIDFKGQSHGSAQLARPDPSTLQITLPQVRAQVPNDLKLGSTAVERVESKIVGDTTVFTLKLVRPMGAQVEWNLDGIVVSLTKPDVGDGKLAGKVIVVDPGHGGHDSGATYGPVREKDLTLQIGTQLAKKLVAAGATVIMTRSTDVFIPLPTRCDIANRTNADFFVSCHINSSGGANAQSGGITFHHLGKDTCRLLAESIQHDIAKVSGLPNLGVWSDGRIYNSGFAVLRGTKMPGVLLELGFINHPKDRKRIITPEFQDAVTTAVVRGIRDFLGDRTE